MFYKKTDSGQEVIKKSLGVFEEVKKELEVGIALCDDEECDLDAQMKELAERKASISNTKKQAKSVKHNIEQMLK